MGYYYEYKISDCCFLICQKGESIARVHAREGFLTVDEKKDLQEKGLENKETVLLKRAAFELEEYFNGTRRTFNIPLEPEGTEFQRKVWNALREISFGETASYGQIAQRIGNPKASRAVGMACNRNPILIMIPCHRVIGAEGKLVGFGCGLEMKEKLLDIERNETNV